ncbi:MAG: diheme cytochrome c-553 [Chitinophagaceae bacterium]
MRSSILIISFIAGILAISVVACTNPPGSAARATVKLDSAALVLRGEYLVTSVGCDDCHSPKRMGAHGPEIIPELRFSGFPHDGKLPPVDTNSVKNGWALFAPDLTSTVGPWGASYAANISSDGSGIGNWREENFMRAIREGKYKGLAGSRTLLPPMPWAVYRNMTDEDLKSIFAYLKTTKPVNNTPPAPKQLAELK